MSATDGAPFPPATPRLWDSPVFVINPNTRRGRLNLLVLWLSRSANQLLHVTPQDGPLRSASAGGLQDCPARIQDPSRAHFTLGNSHPHSTRRGRSLLGLLSSHHCPASGMPAHGTHIVGELGGR